MDDIAKGNTTDIGTAMSSPAAGKFTGNWVNDGNWWNDNFSTRPYVSADRGFEHYEPAYRFGYQSLSRYHGRRWDQVEPSLRDDWQHFEGRGESTWENVKDAVRDAWDHITTKK